LHFILYFSFNICFINSCIILSNDTTALHYTLNVILRTPSIIVLVGFLSAFHTLVTREGITVEEWPLLAGL
ncbi:mCG140104, partial [Mus musculus]